MPREQLGALRIHESYRWRKFVFVHIHTDNQVKSDADANARLEERVRSKLRRFEARLTSVEIHVEDVNGAKGGEADKRVSLEMRPAGRDPVAVHAEAPRVETAIAQAADKAARALDHALGRDRR
jgi:hypothetical protein